MLRLSHANAIGSRRDSPRDYQYDKRAGHTAMLRGNNMRPVSSPKPWDLLHRVGPFTGLIDYAYAAPPAKSLGPHSSTMTSNPP